MIADLSDNRRGKKPWLPADDRDVTGGLVTEGPEGKPACVRHGAMNRVDPVSPFYRCSEQYCGVGAQLVVVDSSPLAARDAAIDAYYSHRLACRVCHCGGLDSGCPKGAALAAALDEANTALPLPPRDPPW